MRSAIGFNLTAGARSLVTVAQDVGQVLGFAASICASASLRTRSGALLVCVRQFLLQASARRCILATVDQQTDDEDGQDRCSAFHISQNASFMAVPRVRRPAAPAS